MPTIELRSDPVLTLPPKPELSLAVGVFQWCEEYIRQPDGPDAGERWRFTTEQRRFLWYFYAIDDDGRFLWSRAVLRRAKGWGKSPFMAAISLAELCGPVRFDGMNAAGEPVGVPVSMPWVQIAGVSEKQTANTMSMVLAMVGESPMVDEYGLDPGITRVNVAVNGGKLEPITASAPTAEGARPTFCVLDETHHWLASNGGHKLAQVIRRNLGKSRDGMARSIETTNAHQVGIESVAERSHDAWAQQSAGKTKRSSILYDSREAPAGLDIADEPQLRMGIEAAYGDSFWRDDDRIIDEVYDLDTPESQARQFYLNQLSTADDAWVDPRDWDDCADQGKTVDEGEDVVLFFDGSKSDDATALVGCRVSDGHVITLGMWQRPPGLEAKERWLIPRADVDEAVTAAFSRFHVVAFWGDPSHAREDVTDIAYWDPVLDDWHRRWKDGLNPWAVPGVKGHAVSWDMASGQRVEMFVAAVKQAQTDITQRELTHDGDPRMARHVYNARRYPTKYGISIGKGHRDSPRKVDLAVAMVGARMLRRLVQNMETTKKRTGRIW